MNNMGFLYSMSVRPSVCLTGEPEGDMHCDGDLFVLFVCLFVGWSALVPFHICAYQGTLSLHDTIAFLRLGFLSGFGVSENIRQRAVQ